jgi:vacuolar protein sorting-associated protein 13A/C
MVLVSISKVRAHRPLYTHVTIHTHTPSKVFAILGERKQTCYDLSISRIGVSIINPTPAEIVYLTLDRLMLRSHDSFKKKEMKVEVGRVQLDNQAPEAAFPIVFAPSPVPEAARQPLLQVTLLQVNDEAVPVLQFDYVSVLLQKVECAVEETMLWDLLAYSSSLQVAVEGEDPTLDSRVVYKSAKEAVLLPEYLFAPPSYLYIKLLELHPLAVDLSFKIQTGKSTVQSAASAQGALLGVLTTVLQAVGALAGNIHDAPLRLNARHVVNASGTADSLLTGLTGFYVRQGLMEVYKILGSLEFLGNPVALVSNLGDGVFDFFYEPMQGLMKGPEEFGYGVAKGSASLLSHSLGGVFGAASSATGALANFGAVISMDDAYQGKRAQNAAGGGPKHVGQGLVTGLESLGSGIAGGLKGVVLDPAKGFKQGGAGGMAKGFAKGLVGLVIKPAVGAIDATSSTLKGIGNTAGFILHDQIKNKRERPQRFVPPSGVLVPYQEGEAMRPPKVVEKGRKKFNGDIKKFGMRVIDA